MYISEYRGQDAISVYSGAASKLLDKIAILLLQLILLLNMLFTAQAPCLACAKWGYGRKQSTQRELFRYKVGAKDYLGEAKVQ